MDLSLQRHRVPLHAALLQRMQQHNPPLAATVCTRWTRRRCVDAAVDQLHALAFDALFASALLLHRPGTQTQTCSEVALWLWLKLLCASVSTLVETAMLAAVSGLAYLVSTLLKLDGSLGYFLPLPVVLAALRGGIAAGWRTMTATGFLLVVLLGPFRSLSYVLIHGLLAASLATMWKAKANFWVVVVVGAAVRMAGQMAYLVLSSVTLNENLFAVMMSNVYAMLDQICAAVGAHGSPSTMAIMCVVFALLSVNALCYVFLLQVIYRFILQSMGYSLGPLPAIVRKYLFAGAVEPSTAEAKLA
ncbi:hypothetical protein QJQ45_016087 [Haematococcus lacustris]|nr:hypothetical protein QJQ45_016087 [Haematococcus lacustris]